MFFFSACRKTKLWSVKCFVDVFVCKLYTFLDEQKLFAIFCTQVVGLFVFLSFFFHM